MYLKISFMVSGANALYRRDFRALGSNSVSLISTPHQMQVVVSTAT